MSIFTVHTRESGPPVLVPERFSWGALFFGPLWLLVHGAWIAAAVGLLLGLGTGLVPEALRAPVAVTVGVGFGLFGHDLRRWSLGRRGFRLAYVVAARDRDEAMARLLEAQPGLRGAVAR